jgi:hypothetical protein
MGICVSKLLCIRIFLVDPLALYCIQYLQAHVGPRSSEILTAIHKPLDGADYDDDAKSNDAVIFPTSVCQSESKLEGIRTHIAGGNREFWWKDKQNSRYKHIRDAE